MTFAQKSIQALAIAVFAVAGVAVKAETFAVQLGGRDLGSLVYQGGSMATLQSTLNNTPLGVFNGSFSAQSERTSAGQQFRSVSNSSRKSREIAVLFDDGRAVDTVVTPSSEMTDLSNVGAVPVGVIDPVWAFGQFVGANGCPSAFRFYDGRRAILVQPTGQKEVAGQLVCDMSYRVSDGPGHLSPLYIKKIAITLTYDVAGGQSLRKMVFSAAGFDLQLLRQG